MSSGNLKNRLSRLRTRTVVSAAAPGKNSKSAPGMVSQTTQRDSLTAAQWHQTGQWMYEREICLPVSSFPGCFSQHLYLLFPALEPASTRIKPSELLFFDLETTGLSRGAGTVIFMAGLGVLDKTETGYSRMHLHQLLLTDYPGESEFLARIGDIAGTDRMPVSYNGRSFDARLLETRCIMNGIAPFSWCSASHLDLLYPARRLWRNKLESCRLSCVERYILGLERTDDLPGSEAPDAWFSWLDGKSDYRIAAIGDHNRDDCLSLALLLAELNRQIDEGRARAALIRALHLRSAGNWKAARPFLEQAVQDGENLAVRLLAIDLEHRFMDYPAALSLANTLEDVKRIDRLEKKLKKQLL